LISSSNHCITDIHRGISLFLPSFSLIVDWRERDRMNSRGLECEAYLFHFKGINGESEGI